MLVPQRKLLFSLAGLEMSCPDGALLLGPAIPQRRQI
jgi:hypothetical protein